jgi:hypothetical protein
MKNIPMDGFTLNPYTILKPYDYHAGALGQMDTLRRANTYRARIHVVPDDFNQPLQPYETLEYEVKVAGGSYLWGVRFVAYDSQWAQAAPGGVTVQVTEACTGIELYREFTNPAAVAFYTTDTQGRGFHVPHLLTEPRLFLEPGGVTVEVCNLTSTLQRCQLLLHFAEPADLIEQKGEVKYQ